MAEVTGWKISSIKTYIKKQWRDFIVIGVYGHYSTNGLITISQENFVQMHSQKLKYRTHLRDERDSLLVKARQFAFLAISVYNNPYSEFRTYGYIINIIIAWTAMFHAIFQRNKMEYFYQNSDKSYQYLDGDKRAWDISQCIDKYWLHDNHVKSNIKFLIGLRNKIEHRNSPIVDLKIAGHFQACANNFEEILSSEFGSENVINRSISLAIQLSRSHDQKQALKEIQFQYMEPIMKYLDDFEEQLPESFLKSPEYRVSYFLAPKISNHKTSESLTIEFVTSDNSNEKSHKVLIKEKEKEKFKPKQIVEMMHNEGYKRFTMNDHTNLWKRNHARNSKYGVELSGGSWFWYTSWVDFVRAHCKQTKL
ncbi:MAG: DUF3644 domain-containing protein [Legionella sp.]